VRFRCDLHTSIRLTPSWWTVCFPCFDTNPPPPLYTLRPPTSFERPFACLESSLSFTGFRAIIFCPRTPCCLPYPVNTKLQFLVVLKKGPFFYLFFFRFLLDVSFVLSSPLQSFYRRVLFFFTSLPPGLAVFSPST